jgi:hypothetical protein
VDSYPVMPAEAGIHDESRVCGDMKSLSALMRVTLGSRLRGSDGESADKGFKTAFLEAVLGVPDHLGATCRRFSCCGCDECPQLLERDDNKINYLSSR